MSRECFVFSASVFPASMRKKRKNTAFVAVEGVWDSLQKNLRLLMMYQVLEKSPEELEQAKHNPSKTTMLVRA